MTVSRARRTKPSLIEVSTRVRRGRLLSFAFLFGVWLQPEAAIAEFQFKKGSFTKSDVTVPLPVDQQVTGVGFRPKAVIFFYTRQRTTDLPLAPNITGGWGFTTGPLNSRAIGAGVLDNQMPLFTIDSGKAQSITGCIVILGTVNPETVGAKAELVQFEPDGFRIRWTANEARLDIIHYVALGGSDITDAVAASFQPLAGMGIEPVAVGFQPDFVMMLSARSGVADGTGTEAQHSIGFATRAPLARVALGVQLEDDDAIRDTWVWQRTDSVLAILNNTGPGDTRFDIAFTPTGFNVDKILNGMVATDRVHYLALKGGRYGVGSFTKNNVTAAPPDLDQAVGGVGFQPVGVMLASSNLPANVAVQAQGRVSLGASDLGSHGATWWHDRDGLDPSDCNMRSSTTQIAVHASGVGGATVDAAGFLKSFDANGFTLTWTANNAGAGANHEILYAAFGTDTNYRSIGTAADHASPVDGTVTATKGSRLVTGAGTQWMVWNRGRGDVITISGTSYTVFRVVSDTQLELTAPFGGATGPLQSYTITRPFMTLPAWEDCVDGPPGMACLAFPVVTASLVMDNRSEVGVAYKDGVFMALPGFVVHIDGSTTDADNTITLTADHGNRHYGMRGDGVVLNGGAATDTAVLVWDDFVTVEWLEITAGSPTFDGVEFENVSAVNKGVVRNMLVYDLGDTGIQTQGVTPIVDVYNNIVHTSRRGIHFVDALTTGSALIFNNTIYGSSALGGITSAVPANPTVTLRNNIAHSNAGGGGDFNVPGLNAASSHNLASDTTGMTHSFPPATGFDMVPLTGAGGINFVSTVALSENLHLQGTSQAINAGFDLSAVFPRDIDNVVRLTPWEIGADDTSQTTAVTLQSFTASPRDGGAELRWETASELSNLGFHLYRGDFPEGPFERITGVLIPGLGSSPTGQSYAYVDAGLQNGRTYYYELEDVETTGRTERHGPVSATPSASSSTGTPPGPGPSGTAHGDPSSVELREVERSARHVVLELRTGGFYASPSEGGRVRLSIPGFESAGRPGEPELPMRRALVKAVSGRKVRLASVSGYDLVRFPGLRPASQSVAEIEVGADGSLAPARRSVREGPGFFRVHPDASARLAGSSFQGETKKTELLLFPLRWDGSGVTLSRRLVVRLEFTGREESESLGSRGRRAVVRGSHLRRGVVAQVIVRERGLYRVDYEDVFLAPPSGGRQRRGIPAARLRLSRRGESVAFHLEPGGAPFRPGSSLYFLSEGSSLNPYGDAVYELETSSPGLSMEVEGLPFSAETAGEYQETLTREENMYYQAGLLEAPDLWLWDIVISPATKSYPFTVDQLAASSAPLRLSVSLQAASDFDTPDDHHVVVKVNGTVLGEARWDGKLAKTLDVEAGSQVLLEGQNALEIENVGDTAASYSFVFLNRFSVSYPRRLVASGGRLEGQFLASGRAEVEGLPASSFLLDTTEAPRWLVGATPTASGLSFVVRAGRSYLATSVILRPEVRRLAAGSLKSVANRADYLLLAPGAFLEAAQPLLENRESQGLVTRAVSLEEVYEQFGHGEVSPEAVKEFLEYAYHSWARPSPRYVMLLGDASYDPKDYLGTGVTNHLAAFPVRTSYLWTASDPAYASVNGDDLLPDVAIGRLPAASVEEAQRLVQKVLAFENGGGNFDGPAVLVADNADQAGNFEADTDEIASTLLSARNPRKIYYSQLLGATRTSIKYAFDQGASFLSYVGHGGTVVWASENIFNYQDVATLLPQSRQPFLLTMNCLNGFFHFPPLNSLSEELLKTQGKGVVAAFSPSGLSLNDAAHLFHKAVLREVLSGRHQRLGDAVLAAQEAYADSGAFPELLSIYHLFGDPALRIR